MLSTLARVLAGIPVTYIAEGDGTTLTLLDLIDAVVPEDLEAILHPLDFCIGVRDAAFQGDYLTRLGGDVLEGLNELGKF